ncbi:MAG: restriction endonuclease subunit S [Ancrocorticia sp.]
MTGARFAIRPLGQIAQIERGKFSARPRNDPHYFGGSMPFVQTGDVRSSDGFIWRFSSSLNDHGVAVSKVFSKGTLLMTIAANIGDVGITSFECAAPDSLVALYPQDGIHKRWLYYVLLANKANLEAVATTNAQANINLEKLNRFEITVPTYAEQRAISAMLVDTDELIASVERLIVKKRAIKQGMMQELLTGRTRLPGFTGEWHPTRFAELLSYQQPAKFLVSSTEYVSAGTPVLTAGKTFLLGHTTDTTGIFDSLPAIIFDDFTTASKYVAFPFKAKSSAMKILSAKSGIDIRFVSERMQLVNFIALDHKRRWIAEYSKIEVDVPSIDEQRAIATVAEHADKEITALERRLEATRAIKQGMMQELLTGRTRLPVKEDAT